MTVSLQTTFNEYTANGTTTIFPFTFKVVEETDLKVYQNNTLLTAGYTVDGVGNPTGGTITFITELPPTNGDTIRLERVVPYSRSTDYLNAGALDADILDADVDRVVMMIQDLDRRSIKTTSGALDAGGSRLLNVSTPVLGTDAATKSYVDTVLTQAGNLTLPNNPADNGKVLKANAGVASWQSISNADVVSYLGYTPANKAGDTLGASSFTSTVSVTGQTTLNATNNVIVGASFTNSPTVPTTSVGDKSTKAVNTTTLNRAVANGGYTKMLQQPIKTSSGMAIAINNQVFVSGWPANRVGKNNTVNISGFVHLPFKNAWEIPNGTTITEIVSNGSSIYVVLSNGWVYSHGYNGYGQLGHGDTAERYSLVRIEYFISNSISINKVWCNTEQYSGIRSYGMAFFRGTNGYVYGCGYNASGDLGIGNITSPILTPTQVLNITNVVDLQCSCAANGHTLAISSNNLKQVWAWGYNANGQLGNGTTTNAPTPFVTYTDPQYNITKIVAVNANYYNGSAWVGSLGSSYILVNNTIKSCGYNGYGQLGNGNTTQQNSWVSVAGTWSNIFSNGGYFTALFALTSTGQLYSCGYNGYGQLGLGNTTNYSTLTNTGMTNVVDVYCSQYSSYGTTIVKLSDGTLFGCGYNGEGALAQHDITLAGTNTSFLQMNIPTHSPIAEVRLLFANNNRYDQVVFLLLEDGSLMGVGRNTYGILSNLDQTVGYDNSTFNFCNLPYK